MAAGMKRKGGGKLTLSDFLPDWCTRKTADESQASEDILKAKLMKMAKATGTYHGKE